MTTSEFLSTQLEKAGISAYQLTKELGWDNKLIYKYLSGNHEPTVPRFKAICKVLGVSNKDIVDFIKEK